MKKSSLIVVLALIAASTSIADSAIGASSASITVCAKKSDGALRLSKSGNCASSERKLILGQQGTVGPQGPIGATGPAGATGPQGERGARGPAGAAGASLVVRDANGLLVGYLLDVPEYGRPADSVVTESFLFTGASNMMRVWNPTVRKAFSISTDGLVTVFPLYFESSDCSGSALFIGAFSEGGFGGFFNANSPVPTRVIPGGTTRWYSLDSTHTVSSGSETVTVNSRASDGRCVTATETITMDTSGYRPDTVWRFKKIESPLPEFVPPLDIHLS